MYICVYIHTRVQFFTIHVLSIWAEQVVDGNWGAHVTIPKFVLKEADVSSLSYTPVLHFVRVLSVL